MKYKLNIVLAFFEECGLPAPETEYRFHPDRKWRFDFAWPKPLARVSFNGFVSVSPIALEVDGGIWIRGGHNRGAQIKATWEKENEAQVMGWRVLKCEPKDLCTQDTASLIKRCFGIDL